jgi:hypothetical protein
MSEKISAVIQVGAVACGSLIVLSITAILVRFAFMMLTAQMCLVGK